MSSAPATPAASNPADGFYINRWIHSLGGLIERHPGWMIRLSRSESKVLSGQLSKIKIEQPIFIAGLARSGTTILLEVIAGLDGIGTHRYRDYPAVMTPYLWDWWLAKAGAKAGERVERAHRDGIFVDADSPEAMEEVIWMTFFSHLHDPSQRNVLDGSSSNTAFETFYRDHLRKLLIVRHAHRYASKSNYNLARLAYIHRLFPDARFIVPIRHPATHIASLIKEHRLFNEAAASDPRTVEHLRRVGHFEFGADLRPINVGDTSKIEEIQQLWKSGEEVRGWARYWAMIYGYVADQLESDTELRDATLIVRFEDLCTDPAATLEHIFAHCRLADEKAIANWAERLHLPTYYIANFSTADEAIIEEEARAVRRRFGYDDSGSQPLLDIVSRSADKEIDCLQPVDPPY